MHRALARLSAERVEDTLLAEAGDSAGAIDEFRGGKAEHNAATLKAVLGVGQKNLKVAIQPLVDLGFLEQTGETWKIPILYRDGLEITQGKAF